MVSLIVEQDTNMPGILMELIGHINTERRSLLMKNILKYINRFIKKSGCQLKDARL